MRDCDRSYFQPLPFFSFEQRQEKDNAMLHSPHSAQLCVRREQNWSSAWPNSGSLRPSLDWFRPNVGLVRYRLGLTKSGLGSAIFGVSAVFRPNFGSLRPTLGWLRRNLVASHIFESTSANFCLVSTTVVPVAADIGLHFDRFWPGFADSSLNSTNLLSCRRSLG